MTEYVTVLNQWSDFSAGGQAFWETAVQLCKMEEDYTPLCSAFAGIFMELGKA